jgi:hypothetical protein
MMNKDEAIRYNSPRQVAARKQLWRAQEPPRIPTTPAPALVVREQFGLQIVDSIFNQKSTMEMLENAYHQARLHFKEPAHGILLHPTRHTSFGSDKYNGVPVYSSASIKPDAVQCILIIQKVIRDEWHDAF